MAFVINTPESEVALTMGTLLRDNIHLKARVRELTQECEELRARLGDTPADDVEGDEAGGE